MKLLSVLGVLFLIFQLSVGETTSKSLVADPCATCNQIVTVFQQALNTETDPNVIFEKLDKICSVASQFIPQEQCSAFIRVYGRFILNQIQSATSVINPESICRDTLQFCPSEEETNPDEPFFVPLIPVSGDNMQINWRVSASQFADQSVFLYKVLVTDVLVSEPVVMQVNFEEVQGAALSLKVDEDESVRVTGNCGEYDAPCSFGFDSVQTTWYYFTIQASQVSQPDSLFTLSINALVAPTIIGEEGHHGQFHAHTHVYSGSILFLLAAVACLCCCGCALRRQEKKKKLRQQIRQQQEQEQQQEALVELAPYPGMDMEGGGEAGQYYYYPNMVFVPQGYYPVPVSAPPATNENLS